MAQRHCSECWRATRGATSAHVALAERFSANFIFYTLPPTCTLHVQQALHPCLPVLPPSLPSSLPPRPPQPRRAMESSLLTQLLQQQQPPSSVRDSATTRSDDTHTSPNLFAVVAVFFITGVIVVLLFRLLFAKRRHTMAAAAATPHTSSVPSHSQSFPPPPPPHHPHPHHHHYRTGPFAPSSFPHTSRTIHVPSQPRPIFSSGRYVNPPPPHPDVRAAITRFHTSTPPHNPPNRYDPENLNSFQATKDDAQNPCPICLVPLEEESVSSGQCLHLMHTSCLKSWLAKDVHSACPICRVTFSDPVDDVHIHTPERRAESHHSLHSHAMTVR